jgi:hypothetical protein
MFWQNKQYKIDDLQLTNDLFAANIWINTRLCNTPHDIQLIIIKLPYKEPNNNKWNRHTTRGNTAVKSTNSKYNQSDTIHTI